MSRPSSVMRSGPHGGIHTQLMRNALDDAVERLGGLLLDHVGERAAGARERHVDDERVVLVVPAEVVDEAEVDDVDAELGVDDVLERLFDLVEALGCE